MLVYVDASVIVRAILPDEVGWQRCAALVADGSLTMVTASWSRVECESAIRRAARNHRVADLDGALAAVEQVFDAFAIVSPPLEELTRGARSMVERHALRTLDTMHLAAALAVAATADHFGHGMGFACVDDELTSAAQHEGMDWPSES